MLRGDTTLRLCTTNRSDRATRAGAKLVMQFPSNDSLIGFAQRTWLFPRPGGYGAQFFTDKLETVQRSWVSKGCEGVLVRFAFILSHDADGNAIDVTRTYQQRALQPSLTSFTATGTISNAEAPILRIAVDLGIQTGLGQLLSMGEWLMRLHGRLMRQHIRVCCQIGFQTSLDGIGATKDSHILP